KGLRLNGEEVNLSDAKDGMITLSVTAGNNYLEFDYSSNTLAIILIIVCAAVIIAAIVAVIFIVSKKKKAKA
ncbi:MAG: hypothetical protein PUB08_06005, partial [Firmicutes bacterium]|nr:hypothetical protein [Bacillota bacterium]